MSRRVCAYLTRNNIALLALIALAGPPTQSRGAPSRASYATTRSTAPTCATTTTAAEASSAGTSGTPPSPVATCGPGPSGGGMSRTTRSSRRTSRPTRSALTSSPRTRCEALSSRPARSRATRCRTGRCARWTSEPGSSSRARSCVATPPTSQPTAGSPNPKWCAPPATGRWAVASPYSRPASSTRSSTAGRSPAAARRDGRRVRPTGGPAASPTVMTRRTQRSSGRLSLVAAGAQGDLQRPRRCERER